MRSEILALGVEFLIQSAFLVLALWIMLKIQSLEYNVAGLFGAAALASGLDMIPYVGHPLSFGLLLFTMTKVTRSDYVDVVFTVGVGYALMFGMNLFLLGALIGDLRPSARSHEKTEALTEARQTDREETAAKVDTVAEPAAPSAPAAPAPIVKKEPMAPSKPSPATGFSLKGLTKNANNSVAMVSTGVKTYTIGLGETISMETAKGKVSVKLEKVEDNSVVLNIGGERVVLSR